MKLISAFDINDMKTFQQISSKLYQKARLNQDKKEYLLAECLKYSRNESIDIDAALKNYNDIKKEDAALERRKAIQCSAKYIEEKDPLKRFMMKEFA